MADTVSRFIPATGPEIERMLNVLGLSSVDDLIGQVVPRGDMFQGSLPMASPISEPELVHELKRLALLNTHTDQVLSFLGAGAYKHGIPSAISHLVDRGEFLTAYTPYQPEISQGTLQAMYEFQTMVCELFGMDVANASTYDGASALAEALSMAHRVLRGRRPRAILAGAIHPDYRATCVTYSRAGPISLAHLPPRRDGRVSIQDLSRQLDRETCCVAVQSPNFYGLLEDLPVICPLVHDAGALLVVVVTDPHACALLRSPGELGADIVVGEGQALGIPLSMGGPHLGLFATRRRYLRQLPGRLVGRTVDSQGQRGFVLTLATREQHIRRARATSNICTNQGLCALMVSIYLSLLGPDGLRQVAMQSHSNALYLKKAISALPGFDLVYNAPFFHELVIRTPVPAARVVEEMLPDGFFAGLPMDRFPGGRSHELLICATEVLGKEQMDSFLSRLARFRGNATPARGA